MGDWLRVVDILALDGTQPVGANLVGSSYRSLNVGARRAIQEGFLGPDPNDDRVEAALVTFAHGLELPAYRILQELSEDMAHAAIHRTPVAWKVLLQDIPERQQVGGTDEILAAGTAAWLRADVAALLAAVRNRRPSPWDLRYLAIRGYRGSRQALAPMLTWSQAILEVRALEAAWAVMLTAASVRSLKATDIVRLARQKALEVGLPARELRVPDLPSHVHIGGTT